MRIKLADPAIETVDEEAVATVLRSGRLVCGPVAKKLEQKLCGLVRRQYAIAVSSGTAALVAAMRALGISPQSTIVVPAFTFPAPAAAAAFLGANVLVCDVDPATFCISSESLKPLLGDRISLVVAVDQFGMPAPVPELEKLLRPRGIPVLVDAACSLGSSLYGEPCGSFGTAAIFSFHPRKVVTTGEGGAVLTNYAELASRVRRVINHGMEDGAFQSTGLNLRLSEVSAALGVSQLDRLEMTLKKRRMLAERYRSRLNLKFQELCPGATANYQTLAAVLPKPMTREDRLSFIEFMGGHGIEVAIASYCLGAEPAIARRLGITADNTPCAKELHERGIALPLHTKLSEKNVDEVINTAEEWLRLQGAL